MDYVIIGRIVRPHGVRGEVKVRPETDFPERFAHLERVLLVGDAGTGPARPVGVEGVRRQGALVLLKLAGIEDVDAARTLQGLVLALPWEERMPLPEGSYYLAQVIGLQVRTPDGEVLGTVTEVLRTAAHDLYRVTGARGDVLLPATREVVRVVDLERGEMIVDVPEGL